MEDLDSFTRALREVCANAPLREKWVVAPSLRVGLQWIDRVARSGQPVLAAHPKTMRGVAVDLASREMAVSSLTFLGGLKAEVFIDGLLGRLRSSERDGLGGLKPSSSLTRALYRTVRDIRLAGLGSREVMAAAKSAEKQGGLFDDDLKGEQVTRLLAWYEQGLEEGGFVDYPGALRLAIELVRGDTAAAIGDALVILPDAEFEVLGALERELWESVPGENKLVLEADRPAEEPGDTAGTDLELLRWLPNAGEAPAPNQDGTLTLFRATGEVNEVREVVRRCAGQGIPFDEVEIMHTDNGTYVPLIYEQLCRMEFEGDEERPVTFEEGLPASFFRPGRALCAWTSWVIEGYPQRTLVRMLQDGLLDVPGAGEAGLGRGRLGTILRSLAVREGRDRYVPAIEARIEVLEGKLAGPEDADEDRGPARRSNTRRELEGLELLRPTVESIIEASPTGDETQPELLRMAREFLTVRARCVNRMDRYARKMLLGSIDGLMECIDEGIPVRGLDVLEWLHSLAGRSQVGGQGPTPGALYVSNLAQGGHSGRKHTFIIGLDDRRFPGAGLQDPLLLDRERSALSPELPTAGDALERKVRSFHRLGARLRGRVTMSYSCRNLADDREASYPAGVVATAYRLLSGEESFDQERMQRWLGPPFAFAPLDEERCIDATEWWMWRTCAEGSGPGANGAVMSAFPHLGRGVTAREMRESSDFTEYDGYVPEAALDPAVNPALEGGRPVSARRFQALGRCPMDFFFSHVLKLEPPEEYTVDPFVWLDLSTKGILLHSLFQEFLSALVKRGEKAEYNRHWPLLKEMLDEQVARYREENPPPLAKIRSTGGGPLFAQVYTNDVAELTKVAEIFLAAETRGTGRGVPLYFEVSIGFDSRQKEGTDLDSREPVEVTVGSGKEAKRIRLLGQIDRVDRLMEKPGGSVYAVWDYKTMGGSKYRTKGPFNEGRYLQAAIYPRLVRPRLQAAAGAGSEVEKFGYIFPTESVRGEPIEWSTEELGGGDRMLWLLCELIERGCFAFSPEMNDAAYSGCGEVFGDLATIAGQAKRKLQNLENDAMRPFRELRGIG